MEQNRIDMFFLTSKGKFPEDKQGIMQSFLEKVDEKTFSSIQLADYKSPTTVIIISIFFGSFGIDRFMLGQTGMGVAKLLTFGGFGFWWLIDLFLIMGESKKYNFHTFTLVAN